MKKICLIGGISLVIVAAVVACYVFMNDKKEDNKAALAFKEEYESLNGKTGRNGKEHRKLSIPEDNPYVKVTKEEIMEMLDNKETFYLYVGDSLCPWCRSMIEQSIKSAKENGVTKIYYVDFWDDEYKEQLRDVYELVDGEIKQTYKATKEYEKMLELCDESLGLRNYTVKDAKGKEVEVNTKRFFGPSFFFIENGKFKKYTDARSSKQEQAFDELTKDILKDEADKFDELFAGSCDKDC